MLDPTASQITQQLSHVLVCECLARLQFDDQFILDNQISKIVSENGSIFIQHLQGMLLLDLHASLTKPMCQTVFVYFFQMSVSEATMKCKRGFTNLITQLKDFFFGFHSSFLRLLCLFAAIIF